MKKLVAKEFCLVKPFVFSIRKKDIEAIPKDWLLLKPVVAGICGSEILYFKGEKEKDKLEKRLPMCLLHEGVAEIVEAGEDTLLKAGTRVIVNPMISCGQCSACMNFEENLCPYSKYMAATSDGLARTLFLYPEKRVIPVPSEVELKVAAMTEPLSIALNAFETSGAEKNEIVAVIGDGPIGYLLTLIASSVGGIPRENLFFIGIIEEKLSLAKDFASIVNSIKEKNIMTSLKGRVDVVFEAAGGGAHRITIQESVDLLKPGGKCILLGISRSEVPIEITKIINKGLILKGSARSRMEHYRKVLDLVKNSEFGEKVERIISNQSFTIRTAKDLEKAFIYADTERGEAKIKPGRVFVFFPL